MWATVHYFVQNILVFDMQKKNFAVTQQSPGKYCNCGKNFAVTQQSPGKYCNCGKNFAVTQQSPGKYCNCGGSVSSKNNEW